MNLRREPIRSKNYLAGSRGQPCAFEIPGVCSGGTDTTVPCHLRDETFGMAEKADDTSVADGCVSCHDVMDGRSQVKLTKEEWLFYALRGLQRTIRSRVLRQIVQIKLDLAKPSQQRPVPPRKPKAQRTKINGKSNWPSGQKIPTRPMRGKANT